MNVRKSIIGDSIKFGFRASIKHVCFFVVTLLAGVAASTVVLIPVLLYLQFFQDVGHKLFALHPSFMYLALFLWVLIVGLFVSGLYLGFNKIALELCDRGKSSVKELFSCFKLVPRFLAAGILYFIVVAGGLILLIVPGIIIGVRCSLFPYFIIDQDAGVIEALDMSYKATKNYGWSLFLLSLVVNIIMKILSSFGLIGSIIYIFAMPFSTLVYAYFYRSLVPQATDRLHDAA